MVVGALLSDKVLNDGVTINIADSRLLVWLAKLLDAPKGV